LQNKKRCESLNFPVKLQKNALAQSKLKDLQEGETVMRKACGYERGNLETKQAGSSQKTSCLPFLIFNSPHIMSSSLNTILGTDLLIATHEMLFF
jgi:hypothetical protein